VDGKQSQQVCDVDAATHRQEEQTGQQPTEGTDIRLNLQGRKRVSDGATMTPNTVEVNQCANQSRTRVAHPAPVSARLVNATS
jgi:hypothetical protein